MDFKASLVQVFYLLWNGHDLGQVARRRERRMLLLGAFCTLTMGLVWGAFFALQGNWILATLDLILICGGLGVGVLTFRNLIQAAGVVMFSTLFVVLCLIAVLFDVPTPQAPRTTHLYLLPLSVAALMAFRTSGVWLRHGIVFLCMVAFVVLSVVYGAPMMDYALPEQVRATGAWAQAAASLAMLYAMLWLMQNDAIGRSALENDLRQAIAQGQLQLHFQPQLDTQSRVIGAEALLRWLHPKRGQVMPGEFIDLAEQTGLIVPIGHWVMEAACQQLRHWSMQPGMEHLRLAVNISQLQFRQETFVAQVQGLIDRHLIDPNLLELELTESMLVEDMQGIIQKMETLRARGVTFSLDDFGTGFSSLSNLKRLPLNNLKIDQSFVRDVLTDRSDASIAQTIIALGNNLGLAVIAEGVETEQQQQFLLENGCHYFQGYLYSRALPVVEFNRFVANHAQFA